MRGKKTPPETIYKIMQSWATTDNYSKTSDDLGVPISTVKKTVEDNKDKPEFVKLCNEKRDNFVAKANRVADKALDAAELYIDKALSEGKDIPINHLMTVVGVCKDKALLLEGKATERIDIIGNDKLKKLAELAGYERKQ